MVARQRIDRIRTNGRTGVWLAGGRVEGVPRGGPEMRSEDVGRGTTWRFDHVAVNPYA